MFWLRSLVYEIGANPCDRDGLHEKTLGKRERWKSEILTYQMRLLELDWKATFADGGRVVFEKLYKVTINQ